MPTAPAPDFTPEDVAHFIDGNGDLPADTAIRLQELMDCDDLKQIRGAWRSIQNHQEALGQMAEDAGVELRVDAIFVYRILEQLSSADWESPGDVLSPSIEVPYRQVLSMIDAQVGRATGMEKHELLRLKERLIVALSIQIGGEEVVRRLIDRLLEVGGEAAGRVLGHLGELYRHRAAAQR